MEPNKKQEIKDDLETFSKSKDYYAKIGKAWKRGYLLYGPPGTAVKDNTELRKLLIDTTSKSIIVIEDIDCSLDLTGQRKPKKEKEKDEKVEKDPIKEELKKAGEEKKQSELDPALIRRGRMDKHIELSYCCFESFKVLANNYLDVTSHDDYFPEIRRLLGETNITPADVAESLMPKSSKENASTCLERLIKAIETAKVEAKLKAEEEKAKAEKEKEKEEKENEKKKKDAAAAEEAKSADDVNENGASMETTSVKEKPESDGAKENGKSEIVKD
ncbi:hypothetical protein MTR67_008847 [Solanum verrucosum]|uniref:AAA+ ATPase At3g28540-like C-terminal domain-containing protein n=1 Tax=Solanum verrucosum TaxID=315347 RepID=A0AAF0Q286_SOLVR|nr:hypothetical protein MTR67_008847 [Solanum verrucosum]